MQPPEYRQLSALVLYLGEVFTPEKLMELLGEDYSFTPQRVACTLMCIRTTQSQKMDGEPLRRCVVSASSTAL